MSGFEGVKWDLREVAFGSRDYRQLLELRFEELRRPLGLEWTREELEEDEGDRHFGLFRDGELLGTLVSREQGGKVIKLRQIAVTGSSQGSGIGRRLMEKVEACLAREVVESCELNSRLNVAGFYEALGYVREGGIFEEIGIPHVRMRKVITNGSA